MANNRSRAQRPSPTKSPARGGRPAGLFTWVAIAVVVVIVAALVIIKVASGGSNAAASTFQPADPSVVNELTSIPASVFNSIGVSSPVVAVTPPSPVSGQPTLSAAVNGKTLPEIFYEGGEYCPFCAAQRWSTIVALSRFGTWSGLGNMASYSGDVYPNTPTFTFVKAHFSSKFVVFKSVEAYGNTIDPSTNQYTLLQTPTRAEDKLVSKYDSSRYIKGASTGSIPFMSFANKFFVAGASYTPAALSGLSRNAIAAGLSTTSSPVTRAIVASANYQSAAICSLTHDQPSSVCTSSGVVAAKKAMGIK